jgi:uncharacterized protein YydD (DUF2326 family)
MKRIREAKVTFNNKKQLLCSNNLSLEMKKKLQCHSWIGYIIRHSEFVVNILEETISGKKAMGRP